MLTMHQQSVNIDRLTLIKKLEENRVLFVEEYNAALIDYKEKVISDLTATLERAQAGDFSNVAVNIAPPPNHINDYDNIIEMLKYSVDDNIQLDKESFQAYMKNDWKWMGGFRTLSASYKTPKHW